jgi:hypothetical protein
VCRLGDVESIYTSVSARYVVRCPEWQRVTDQINAAAVSLCNTETGDLRIADIEFDKRSQLFIDTHNETFPPRLQTL